MPSSPLDILTKVKNAFAVPIIKSTTLPPPSPFVAPKISLPNISAQPLPTPQQVLAKIQTPGQSTFGTPFTQAVSKKAADAVVTNVPKVAGAIGTNLGNIRDVFEGKLSMTPADLLYGVKQTFGGIQDMAHGINEGVLRAVKSAFSLVSPTGVDNVSNNPVFADFGKMLTGKDTTPTYQDIYGQAHEYATENKASPQEAMKFAGLAVLGTMFADNPAVGPEGEGFKLSVQAAKDLAKTTDEGVIKTILKAENPGLSATQLEALTPIFRDAKDTRTVDKAVQVLESLKKPEGLKTGYLAREAPKYPTPSELYDRVHGAPDTPGAVLRPRSVPGEPMEIPAFTRAAAEMGKPIDTVAESVIPRELEPLAQEARKYATADEFRKRVASALQSTDKTAEPVVHATHILSQQIADTFGHVSTAAASEAELQAYKKGFEDFYNKAVQMPEADTTKRAELSIKTDHVPTSNPTTLPNVADKAKPNVARFAPNLLKAISEERMVGPIADTLRKEFPKLSDRIVESVASRLKDMSRTSDIEGMLRVLDRAQQGIGARAKRAPTIVRAIDSTQPKAISDILTAQQRDVYMESVTRAIEKREDAVFAQQEYDALWEAADPKIIDRYNELVLGREILAEQVELHPGKKLVEYQARGDKGVRLGKLPEITGVRSRNFRIGKKETRAEEFARTGDTLVEDLGFKDFDEAQKGLENYISMRQQLAELEQEARELRPHARASQQAQTLVKDVPVVLQQKAGEIDALTTPEIVRSDYKDISGFKGQVRDVYRNFRAVFGRQFDDIKRIILDPFDKSKGDAIDTMKEAGDRLDANIVKGLGIKRGSKLDAAVMDFGEGKLSEEGLKELVGGANVEKVRTAAAWFRKEYDAFIDALNIERAKIYPNDPTKLIQKRKDYFRHFQELSGDNIKGFLDVLETPAGIDPQLAGVSEFTTPKTKFLSFAQRRLGKDSERSAIGGYIDYVPAYAYALHIDKHIGNFRYLRRKMADVAPRPGITEIAEEGGKRVSVERKGINNFLEYLDDYANFLSGKSNPADRYIQKIMPGGRKSIKVIGMINNRIKANTILGNFSSAVAQIFNVPQGLASAKLYSFSGAKRTLASVFAENTPMTESDFIKERFHQSMKDRFDIDWVEHPIQAGTQQSKKFATWITGALDEMGTKFIWNAHYSKAVAENVVNPVKYADDITRDLVAGRGIGEKPLLQESKVFNVVAPFSLEVGNAWFVLGDFVKRKDFGAIAIFFIASYLMNEAAQKIRGSRVVFDPINATLEGLAEASDEMKAGNPGRAALKFAGREMGEVLSNVPLGQTFASVIPDQWVQNTTQMATGAPITKAELFGQGDPGRFGSTILPVSGLTDPLYRLLLPFGGTQVKKTQEAIQSMLSGSVSTGAGKLSFKTPTDPVSVVQAFLFGKNSTLEAQKAFADRDDLFNRVYRQTADRTELGLNAEKAWADIKQTKQDKGGAAAAQKLDDYVKQNPDLADAIIKVADEERQGLNSTDRLIGMLGVQNGERAKFIADTLKSMSTKEERVRYISDLSSKKLIDDTVVDQITYLMTSDTRNKVAPDYDLGDAGSYPAATSQDAASRAEAETLKEFPFTDQARAEIGSANIGVLSGSKENSDAKDSTGVQGLFKRQGADFVNFVADKLNPFSPKAAKFIIDHTQMLQRLDKANIDISNTSPEILAHEMLHQIFDKSPLSTNPLTQNDSRNTEALGSRFMSTWDDLANDSGDEDWVPVLREIDKHIDDNYDTASMDPSDFATERFAYLGEQVVKEGLDIIPPKLRPYYEQVFTFPKRSGRK